MTALTSLKPNGAQATSDSSRRILIMAAGTGGHIFPALAIARQLQQRGLQVEWLASVHGMEHNLLAQAGFRLHRIAVRGLRGKGWRRQLLAPLMLLRAVGAGVVAVAPLAPRVRTWDGRVYQWPRWYGRAAAGHSASAARAECSTRVRQCPATAACHLATGRLSRDLSR